MGALLILFLMAGYLWLVYQIARRVPRWAKPLVVIAAVLVVSADGYLGRKKLEQLCEEQGGLHIYKTVDNVEGFETSYYKPDVSWLDKYNYIFVEGRGKIIGKVNRIEKQETGKVKYEIGVEPKSHYLSQALNTEDHSIFGRYSTNSLIIIEKETGDILAKYSTAGYSGGWVERTAGKIYANQVNVARCSKDPNLDLIFWENQIVKILKPIERER